MQRSIGQKNKIQKQRERERERERERVVFLKGIEGFKDFIDLINK